jgi:molecular chaperone Hsp33
MTLGAQIAWDDTVLPFQLDRSDIRGRVARLDGVLSACWPARLSRPDRGAGGRGALLTAMIGQTLKLRWRLSLQIRGNGPARLIATDYFAPDRGRRPGPHPRLCQLRPRPAGPATRPLRPRSARAISR